MLLGILWLGFLILGTLYLYLPDRRWFTVSFPTPLVFRYHLPLNNQNPKNLTMEWMCAKNYFLSLQDEPLKEWRVAHYQQKYHWDCGLSCCIMVLPDHQKDHLMTNFSKVSISWSCQIITRHLTITCCGKHTLVLTDKHKDHLMINFAKVSISWCSTTGKPTHSFATERVSLDSV